MTSLRFDEKVPNLGQNSEDLNMPKDAPWFTDPKYDVIMSLGHVVFEFPAKNCKSCKKFEGL